MSSLSFQYSLICVIQHELAVMMAVCNELQSIPNQCFRYTFKSLSPTVSTTTNIAALLQTQITDGQHTRTEPLVQHGNSTLVTNANIMQYIHLLSHYKQNKAIQAQCHALLQGFRTLIPLEWIRMFNTHELQLLLSGDQRRINIMDMRQNTHYSGGYANAQPYIDQFWDIVSELSTEDQCNLLRFITSSPRQPLLGFKQLNPMLAIQQVPAFEYGTSVGGAARLPSAATCMNLLKLPKYDSKEQLREKLLYAIRSKSGFELS